MRAMRGHWMRRGGTIVVDLGGEPAEEQEFGTKPFWQRVIQSRIDVDAQRALITMNNSGDPDAAFLMTMFDIGWLYGIFKPDQQEPAKLIRQLCGNWWDYLKPNLRGRLLCHSTGRVSLVFRSTLTKTELIALLQELAASFRSLGGQSPCANGAECL